MVPRFWKMASVWDRMILEMELKQIRKMLEKEREFARFLYTP
jgi:hypothetical protein